MNTSVLPDLRVTWVHRKDIVAGFKQREKQFVAVFFCILRRTKQTVHLLRPQHLFSIGHHRGSSYDSLRYHANNTMTRYAANPMSTRANILASVLDLTRFAMNAAPSCAAIRHSTVVIPAIHQSKFADGRCAARAENEGSVTIRAFVAAAIRAVYPSITNVAS